MDKYRLSRLFLPSAILSLVLLLLYYGYKFYRASGHGRLDHAYGFNALGLAAFVVSTVLLLLLLYRLKIHSGGALVTLFFILSAVIVFSFDFSLPSIWPDALEDIKVGRTARDQGCSGLLREYHTRSLMRIKQDPERLRVFTQEAGRFGLDYAPLLDEIGTVGPEEIEPTRAMLHPPLWFCVLGMWQARFGDSYLSYRVLDKVMAMLYLLSLYALLGLLLKDVDTKKKLSILSLFLLMPIFLGSAIAPKNDLVLGFFVIWALYFLFRNRSRTICVHDVMVGLAFSLAVLSKLTALTLIVPLLVYYLVEFRQRCIPKLVVMLLCFAALPLVLRAAYGYDLILNILTGRVSQAEAALDISLAKYVGIIVVYGQYFIGAPFVLLLVTHMFRARPFLARNAAVLAYSFLAFFYLYFVMLYGSHAYKNLAAYLPLTVPILAHIYLNTGEKRKMTLYTGILLTVNTLLLLVNKYTMLNDTSMSYIRRAIVE